LEMASIIVVGALVVSGIFAAYNLLHYILFVLVTNPKDAGKIGYELNEFERRQLVEWAPKGWRYNFLGANVLVFKLRRLGFEPIRYRHLPFWAWGLTWNFIQHLFLWKFRLRMRTMVELERIIWRTSKIFVFGNGYNIVLATKPGGESRLRRR
jgi:hypothetical protein